MAYKQDLSTKHMGSYERFCVDDACAIAQFLPILRGKPRRSGRGCRARMPAASFVLNRLTA